MDLDIPHILFQLERLLIAFALALPIGWEREKHERSAGIRTFPLVALASCGYLLMAEQMMAGSEEARARVLEGIITGMGFIGGGAILKQGATVSGTATAASIWNTGAVGASVAFGRYEVAVILALVNFVTLRFFAPLKDEIRPAPDDVEPKS
jgi:putative Mg2+ transporter-C (MgtC) family protein